jgi:hypothetical protein
MYIEDSVDPSTMAKKKKKDNNVIAVFIVVLSGRKDGEKKRIGTPAENRRQ